MAINCYLWKWYSKSQIMKRIVSKSIFTIFVLTCISLNCSKSRAMGTTERDKTYDIGICTDKGKVNPENEDTCGVFTIGQDIVCVVCIILPVFKTGA